MRDAEVGTWFVEGREGDIALTMLEACNKIIHADRMKLEARKVRKSGFQHAAMTGIAAGFQLLQDLGAGEQ